jgi:hypothetical protein
MTAGRFVLIDEGRPVEVDARLSGGRVRLSAGAVTAALGWEVTAEGLCRDGMCLPVDPDAPLASDDGIDLAALAAALDRPVALDAGEGAAYLGVSAAERARPLRSLWAPDFTLGDLDGRMHALSAQRGRKVVLALWASW